MGHGILSGSPFHMIGGWATDMSVDYAELHRWERENGLETKGRKSNFRRRSAKSEITQSKMPNKPDKAVRSFWDFVANKHQKPNGYISLPPTKALEIINSTNFDALTLNLKIFCTGYGIGVYTRKKMEYDSLCFEKGKHQLKLYEIKELFRTGKVVFLQPKIQPPARQNTVEVPKKTTTRNTASIDNLQPVKPAKKERKKITRTAKIFQGVPYVKMDVILDYLKVGQMVINYQLRVGKITALTGSTIIVDFGRNTKKYKTPKSFTDLKLKVWGPLNGFIYKDTQRKQLLEKFEDIKEEINSLNELK